MRTKGRSLLITALERDSRTQQWLATKTGISQPTISHHLKGISRPREHHRVAYRLVLGIPSLAWLTRKERKYLRDLRARLAANGADAPARTHVEASRAEAA